ncbi:hypothetical protein AWRI1631_42900 [Saccharomyces cerevisiae AWRI1631]|uniref:Uncharacterized protein n=1 Tax=Saccharomyces cerevisiae (strain AWRI1631) TaxID=545124 RepID=B5VFW7_YEAS6|nr:hypothetical protein AWRI1631_42900 [Saccharomyces cerevisiae AWRI1631]
MKLRKKNRVCLIATRRGWTLWNTARIQIISNLEWKI